MNMADIFQPLTMMLTARTGLEADALTVVWNAIYRAYSFIQAEPVSWHGSIQALERMQIPRTVGYSGTPLAKKLGLRESSHVLLVGAPENFVSLLEPLPAGVVFESRASASVDIAHIFVTRKEDLTKQLTAFRGSLKPDAVLWVSWPKKAARVVTTVTEDTIREIALPLGFVDVKVCAIDEIWSGLKLVVRKELR